MGYLQPIKRLSAADNKGSILKIQVARKADISFIPLPVRGVIAGDIIFIGDAGFTQWDVTLETAGIKSTAKQSREGISRNSPLAFSIPKDNAVSWYQFQLAENDDFIISYTDGNGIRKLFGLLEAPVRFSFNHSSGTRFADGNRYDCQFYYEGPNNINFYTGSITSAPPSTDTCRVEFITGELISLLSPTDVLIVSSDFAHTFQLIPGTGTGLPALIKWDTGELIASLQPGDRLIVDTDFTFDLEIIGNL